MIIKMLLAYIQDTVCIVTEFFKGIDRIYVMRLSRLELWQIVR